MNLFRQIKTIQNRKIIIVVIISIMIILNFGYRTFIHGRYVLANVISVSKIRVEDNHLIISGGTISSGTGFSGYKYKIDDENLYLKLRYSVVSKVNSLGRFDISIIDDDIKNIKNIFIQGRESKDIEQIWSKQ